MNRPPGGEISLAQAVDGRARFHRLGSTCRLLTHRGDTATVLALMTEDVVCMVPGREPFGKEAFENTSNNVQAVTIDGTSEIKELRVLGDWAYNAYLSRLLMPSS
jgi:uncharacterized protein (TIGR02246 family)